MSGNPDIEQYPAGPIRLRNPRLLVEYERIAAELTRTTMFYFEYFIFAGRFRRSRTTAYAR
jgi:hypothetical protein